MVSEDAPIGADVTDPPPPPVAGAQRAVARAAAVVGTATLVSRILGFLRDLVIARGFGAGPGTDAFFVAFRLPNLLRRLVAEGALSSAFIPVFTEYSTKRSRADNLRMLRAVTGTHAAAPRRADPRWASSPRRGSSASWRRDSSRTRPSAT